MHRTWKRLGVLLVAVACVLALAGCDTDAAISVSGPFRDATAPRGDPQLAGRWLSADGEKQYIEYVPRRGVRGGYWMYQTGGDTQRVYVTRAGGYRYMCVAASTGDGPWTVIEYSIHNGILRGNCGSSDFDDHVEKLVSSGVVKGKIFKEKNKSPDTVILDTTSMVAYFARHSPVDLYPTDQDFIKGLRVDRRDRLRVH